MLLNNIYFKCYPEIHKGFIPTDLGALEDYLPSPQFGTEVSLTANQWLLKLGKFALSLDKQAQRFWQQITTNHFLYNLYFV